MVRWRNVSGSSLHVANTWRQSTDTREWMQALRCFSQWARRHSREQYMNAQLWQLLKNLLASCSLALASHFGLRHFRISDVLGINVLLVVFEFEFEFDFDSSESKLVRRVIGEWFGSCCASPSLRRRNGCTSICRCETIGSLAISDAVLATTRMFNGNIENKLEMNMLACIHLHVAILFQILGHYSKLMGRSTKTTMQPFLVNQ